MLEIYVFRSKGAENTLDFAAEYWTDRFSLAAQRRTYII